MRKSKSLWPGTNKLKSDNNDWEKSEKRESLQLKNKNINESRGNGILKSYLDQDKNSIELTLDNLLKDQSNLDIKPTTISAPPLEEDTLEMTHFYPWPQNDNKSKLKSDLMISQKYHFP